jgi:hypothetical protein
VAGHNQHNIPQALLRGFRIPGGSKKESKTWLYGKGIAPHLELIKDEVAVERHFYSEPSLDGSRTLDDEITNYETAFGRRLNELKSAPINQTVDVGGAAEIVAHLTIRNAHLRRTFTGGVKTLLDRAVEVFCNEATLRPILGFDRETPTERFKTLIDEHLKENPALATTGLPAHVLYQIAHMTLKERFRTFFAEQAPFLTALLGTMTAQAPVLIRDGHNKALSSGLTPDARIDLLKKLDWRILPSPRDGFVLPDCVALAANDQSGFKPLIMADLEDVTAVLMPLSSERMLAGFRQSTAAPALEAFNEAAITASHSFFIAARLDERLTVLVDRIGESSGRLIDDTIGSTFNEFLAERTPALTAGTAVPNSDDLISGSETTDAEREQAPPPPPRYSVHFLGCADEATAERIAATLYTVTESLVQMMPLDRLDGITFASDYPAALRDLDRRFASTVPPLQPTTEEYGVGVAMAPTVMRDGVCKTHIVMRGEFGHSLINEDESIWRIALHVVVGQLAHAACTQILDESLPGVLLKPIDDRYDGFLYNCIHSAWTGYFTSRASAAFYPEGGLPQQELLLSVLKRAQDDIPAARLAYRFHGNIDKLLEIVMPRIADILRFSGSVLGHYGGLEKSFFDEPALTATLEAMGLRDWLILFDSELSGLWDRRGKWGSFNEFLMLNRHVERLFWLYGMFPWRTDDGRIHVTIPLASDAGRLVGSTPRIKRIAALVLTALKTVAASVAGDFRRQSVQ